MIYLYTDPERTGRSDWSALEDSRNVYVTFDSPPTSKSVKFGFRKLVPFLDETLNVAVLEISEPEGLPPPLVLCMKDARKVDGQEVTTIGYGLPGSYKKHINIRCKIVKQDSNRAKQVGTMAFLLVLFFSIILALFSHLLFCFFPFFPCLLAVFYINVLFSFFIFSHLSSIFSFTIAYHHFPYFPQ